VVLIVVVLLKTFGAWCGAQGGVVGAGLSRVLFEAYGDCGFPVLTITRKQCGVRVFWLTLFLGSAVVDEGCDAVVEVFGVGECVVFDFLLPYCAWSFAVSGLGCPFWSEG